MTATNDSHLLVEYFAKRFTADNFFRVFFCVEGFLDVEASPDLGKWYLRNIYANLMMRMKLHLDWARDGEKGISNSRKDFLAFVKSMTKVEEYQAVTRECFVELAGRVSRQRRGDKEKAKAQIPEDGKLFHLIGAPPPPPAPHRKAQSGSHANR